MKSRPFFNKSIRDLENIHRDNLGDVQIRKALLHELEFRSTARASNLKSQIIDQVTPPQPHQASKPETSASPSNEAPPESPLPHFSPGPKPPITNETQNILSAWTALEVLSPQGYRQETDLVGGNRLRIADIDNSPLPWKMGEKSLPKKRLYYELILGTINLGPAIEALLKLYSDNRPDVPRINRRSPNASILLDKKGRPLEEETSFSISSFAWGVPIALQGDLKLLAQWPTKEREFKKAFRKELIQRDTKGEVLPLSKERIENLYSILVSALHLKGHDVAPPHFAIRRYEYFASKVSPEPNLLNSFFLDDLTNARHLAASSKLPRALKFYLGDALPNTHTDLLENQAGLRTLLQPSSTPLGR